MSFALRSLVAAAVIGIASVNVGYALSITLTPTDDTYIQEKTTIHGVTDPNKLFVANGRSTMLQFDLSKVPGPITSAKLTITAGEEGDVNIDGYILTPVTSFVKFSETTLTRNLYVSDYASFEGSIRDLGSFTVNATSVNQLFESLPANSTEIELLNTIRANGSFNASLDDQHLFLSLQRSDGTSGGMFFNSKEVSLALAPKLEIEYVPEPSCFLMAGIASFGFGYVCIRRRRMNA